MRGDSEAGCEARELSRRRTLSLCERLSMDNPSGYPPFDVDVTPLCVQCWALRLHTHVWRISSHQDSGRLNVRAPAHGVAPTAPRFPRFLRQPVRSNRLLDDRGERFLLIAAF